MSGSSGRMRAVQISKFGAPEVLRTVSAVIPSPGSAQVLVRIHAAGVGPWDELIRAGKSTLPQPLPLIPGADFSGVIEAVAPDVHRFGVGDCVYGATNSWFTGAYAEYALASASMIAPKPYSLDHFAAATVPVAARTAWQMLFDFAQIGAGDRVVVLGAAGSVGSFAIQFAKLSGARPVAAILPGEVSLLCELGVEETIDAVRPSARGTSGRIKAVIDTVGGNAPDPFYEFIEPGGILVSCAAKPDPIRAAKRRIRTAFVFAEVTSHGLARIGELIDSDRLRMGVDEIVPLGEARRAHEMLEGRAKASGRIVLKVVA